MKKNMVKTEYLSAQVRSFDKIHFYEVPRIPTVKLENPGKAFLKSESRASVTSVLAKSQPLPLVDS